MRMQTEMPTITKEEILGELGAAAEQPDDDVWSIYELKDGEDDGNSSMATVEYIEKEDEEDTAIDYDDFNAADDVPMVTTVESGDNDDDDNKIFNIEPAQFRCSKCVKIFQTMASLDEHSERIHSTNKDIKKPFLCKECGKSFRLRLSLTIHIRSHTDERPYVCETCGKAFRTCSAVNSHRIIHSDAKDFPCTLCAYRASTKANLRIHDRTHSRVKPYGCSYCESTFRTISNMHKHIRNVHEKMKTHKVSIKKNIYFFYFLIVECIISNLTKINKKKKLNLLFTIDSVTSVIEAFLRVNRLVNMPSPIPD